MGKCCGDKPEKINNCDSCNLFAADCFAKTEKLADDPSEWFGNMIDHCYDYASEAKKNGRPIVGIMCEFAPRELIIAAGGIPVCLCGGSSATITHAEEYLPANLCPLIKSTFGYSVTKGNPFLEMADLVVAETTCDGKKKMFELLAESHPVYLLELTQKQDDNEAFEHWTKEIYKLKTELETRFDVKITDQSLRDAVKLMNKERTLRKSLADLMKSDNPQITGRQLLDFKSSISGIPADLNQYENALKLYSKNNECSSNKSKVRVLLTGVPVVHGAERVVDIIEDSGGLIVCQENCTGLKPIAENIDPDADNIIQAIAKKYFRLHCAVMTRNNRRIDMLKKFAEEYKADCIIDLVWQACTTYDIESYYVKRLAEEDLHLPYLRIETDYSPSDSARIAVRVEALFETIHGVCAGTPSK